MSSIWVSGPPWAPWARLAPAGPILLAAPGLGPGGFGPGWPRAAQILNFKPLVLGVRSLGLGCLTGPDLGWLAQLDSAWLGLAHLFQVPHPLPELVLIGSASHCLALADSTRFWLNPNIKNYLQETSN